jgi:hypothetical protein
MFKVRGEDSVSSVERDLAGGRLIGCAGKTNGIGEDSSI